EFGSGTYRSRSLTATGSNRDDGIWAFGKARPVSGSLGRRVELEKSPRRSASVGGMAVAKSCVSRILMPWYDPKKKVRLRIAGPPNVKPNWFCLRSGLSAEKKFRAFSALFRRYSQADPWKSLAPERVTATNTAPLYRPYSALKLLVWTRNSCSASGEGKLSAVF